jgi:hypothetical protein
VLSLCAFGQGSSIPPYTTPLWRTFLDGTTAEFQADSDSTTFFQVLDADGGTPVFNVDSTNEQVTIGKTSATYPFLINSTDGSDQIQLYHDNTDAWMQWTDGWLQLKTAENNTNTIVAIKGNGTGYGFFRCYNAALDNWLEFRATTNRGFLRYTGSTHTVLSLQDSADIPIHCFENSTEGETAEFAIYGYRTGDASRSLRIGVGTDAADTVSFDGLSNYLFDGNIKANDIISTPQDTTTLGVGVTTFAITSNVVTLAGDGGGNTVATITGADPGTLLTIIFVDGLVTITDTDGHGANTIDLAGTATDLVSADDMTLQLVYDGTSWYETSRSVN